MFDRFLYRLAVRLANRYEGAQWSPTRSYLTGTVQSARFDASTAVRKELVRKARYFEKNSALVQRMADLFEQYVVGQGLVVQPASSDPEWNKRAADWWATWCQYPDLTTLQSYGTLQGLMARSWFIDGEVFKLRARGETGIPRIQLFEGHQCETPDKLRETPSVVDGIKLDDRGRPSTYFLFEDLDRSTRRWTEKPANEVRHIFEPSRVGMLRGLPFLSAVINDLHDLDDMQVLEMQNAKNAARITDVIKTASGELDPAALRRLQFASTNQNASGANVAVNRSDYYKDVNGAAPVLLRPGDEWAQFKSERPSQATRDFWRLVAEKICIGCGFPYVLVVPDSMQGTVYRGALDSAAAFFRSRFSVMADDTRDTWSYVMGYAKGLPEMGPAPKDWFKVVIHPPRAVNVDVGRNSAAMLAELAAGATSYDLIYGPLGLDWKVQFDQLAAQQKYAKEIGLNLGVMPAEKAQPTPGNPGDNEDGPPIIKK